MIDTHRQARNPFEITAVVVCIYAGVAQLIVGSAPTNIERYVSGAYSTSWTWLLLVSAVICAVGIVLPDESIGLYMEVSGLLGLAWANMAYGLTIIFNDSNGSSFASYAAPFSIGFAIAFLIRAFRISRKIWQVLRHSEEHLFEEIRNQVATEAEVQARKIIKSEKEKQHRSCNKDDTKGDCTEEL